VFESSRGLNQVTGISVKTNDIRVDTSASSHLNFKKELLQVNSVLFGVKISLFGVKSTLLV
jgi:hypothetical protein